MLVWFRDVIEGFGIWRVGISTIKKSGFGDGFVGRLRPLLRDNRVERHYAIFGQETEAVHIGEQLQPQNTTW